MTVLIKFTLEKLFSDKKNSWILVLNKINNYPNALHQDEFENKPKLYKYELIHDQNINFSSIYNFVTIY